MEFFKNYMKLVFQIVCLVAMWKFAFTAYDIQGIAKLLFVAAIYISLCIPETNN